jgi:hypothetical protein
MSQVYYIGSPKFLGSSSLAGSACPYTEDVCFEAGDLLLTPTEYWPHITEIVVAAKKAGVVTIHLSDGILEWRNSFEQAPSDVENVGNYIWKPIHSDYFLALGADQKRVVECWGNFGKCYAIGAPRMENEVLRYAEREWEQSESVVRRVLVASAKKFAIGLTDAAVTLQAYQDLKRFFEEKYPDLPVCYQPIWRVSDQLALELGLTQEQISSGQGDLAQVIDSVDVVVTGPSTLMLEAMLHRKPVVCLDYTSSPQFVRAAWNIRSEKHIIPAFFSLLALDSHRVDFQEFELKEQLRLDGSPSRRLDEFIDQVLTGEEPEETTQTDCPSNGKSISHEDALLAQLRYLIRQERESSNARIKELQLQVAKSRNGRMWSCLKRLLKRFFK